MYFLLPYIAKLDHKEIIIHTVNMLNNCKISQYKIKKILEYFVKDYTSTEAAKLAKLNRKTLDRYYNIFRKIILQIIMEILKIQPKQAEYIGYIKGTYGPKAYLKIYKVNKNIFLFTKMFEKPIDTKFAIHDKDFEKYLFYLHKRFSKFHGFTEQSYYYQLYEVICRYNFSEEDLFNLIWKQFLKH